jgi:hypothetical protein
MGEDNNNLINFIATTVEDLRGQIAMMRDQMAMKDQVATKDDIVRLESRMEIMREEMATNLAGMATKEDLASLEHRLREDLASKDDLARLATTVRGDFEQVHFRFDTLERVIETRFGQVETDISRIRSVLYLLVKDKPDMLRLLGRPIPGESRPQG